jgi:hypothetical protein
MRNEIVDRPFEEPPLFIRRIQTEDSVERLEPRQIPAHFDIVPHMLEEMIDFCTSECLGRGKPFEVIFFGVHYGSPNVGCTASTRTNTVLL